MKNTDSFATIETVQLEHVTGGCGGGGQARKKGQGAGGQAQTPSGGMGSTAVAPAGQ